MGSTFTEFPCFSVEWGYIFLSKQFFYNSHGPNYHILSYLSYFKTCSSDFSWRCCGVAMLSQGDVVVEISGNRPYRDITMWTYCIIAVPMWKCHVMLCHENVMSMTKKKQSLLQCHSDVVKRMQRWRRHVTKWCCHNCDIESHLLRWRRNIPNRSLLWYFEGVVINMY